MKKIFNALGIKGMIIVVLSAVIAFALIKGWYAGNSNTPRLPEYASLPAEKPVANLQRRRTAVKEVEVYDKKSVSDVLKLPENISNAPEKEITANAEIPAYKGKTSVISVIDKNTGRSEIVAKQKPLPLFEFLNEKEIGIRYGYQFSLASPSMAGEIYGRYTFARLGNVHIAAYGVIDNKPTAKAMIEGSYRW